MSDFHLKTELDGDPDEQKNRMAEAIELGLRHCATDPLIRLKMILGETYADVGPVIERLTEKLAKENEAVREMAWQVINNPTLLSPTPDRMVVDIQTALLEEAWYMYKIFPRE